VSAQIDWSTHASGHRSFVVTLACCAIAVIAGVAAGLYGHTIPVFSVPLETAHNAYMAWCTDRPSVDEAAGGRYLVLFTDHYAWTDAAIGLVLGAITVASIASVLRLSSVPNETWLRTPKRRWIFLLLGTGVLVSFYVSAVHSLSVDLERMTFPWCADSIAIPTLGLTMLTMFVVPLMLLVGWAITRLFGSLPAPLTQWDRTRPVRSWIVSLVFGAAMVGTAALLITSLATSTNTATPAGIVALYLLASARAALLNLRPSLDAEEPAPA
jgi:hypothetical protein